MLSFFVKVGPMYSTLVTWGTMSVETFESSSEVASTSTESTSEIASTPSESTSEVSSATSESTSEIPSKTASESTSKVTAKASSEASSTSPKTTLFHAFCVINRMNARLEPRLHLFLAVLYLLLIEPSVFICCLEVLILLIEWHLLISLLSHLFLLAGVIGSIPLIAAPNSSLVPSQITLLKLF